MRTLALLRALRSSLRRPALWGVFLFVYGCYCVLLCKFRPMELPGVWRLLAGQFTSSFLFFFAMVWLAPLPWRWGGSGPVGPGLLRGGVQALLCSEAWMLALVGLENPFRSWAGLAPHPPFVYWLHALFMAPALFLVGYLQSMKDQAESEKRMMGAQVAEAQSRQLQGQLHPHVLFNALNALAELIQEDPAKAEVNVRAMSSLLRRVLNASEAATFALGEELALVQDYLRMESMRLEQRLRVSWDWEPALDDLRTLPLLLQPLVENAVKHGIARSREGGELVILGRCETGVLILEVRNSGRGLDAPPLGPPGIGIKNLRTRLAMAYGEAAILSLRSEGRWTVAEVRIQLDRLSVALRSESGAFQNLAGLEAPVH